ncbi:MAG: hypothetical protein KUG77_26535, partial [Nannocystaceae bacterium]|nr:hypothetical protein [Nannocystaceae bacterium]
PASGMMRVALGWGRHELLRRDPEAAVERFREAARLAEGIGHHGFQAFALVEQAEALLLMRRDSDAVPVLGRATELIHRAYRPGHLLAISSQQSLAHAFQRGQQPLRAISTLDSLVEQLSQARPGSPALAGTLVNLGLVHLRSADESPGGPSQGHERAREVLEAALLIFSGLDDPEGMAAAEANLAELAFAQGYQAEAIELYARAKAHLEELFPANDPRVTSLDDELARARASKKTRTPQH